MKKHSIFCLITIGLLGIMGFVVLANLFIDGFDACINAATGATRYIALGSTTYVYSYDNYFSFINPEGNSEIIDNLFSPIFQLSLFNFANIMFILPTIGIGVVLSIIAFLIPLKSDSKSSKIVACLVNLLAVCIVGFCFTIVLFEKALLSVESIVHLFRYASYLAEHSSYSQISEATKIVFISANSFRILSCLIASSLIGLSFISFIISSVLSFIKKRIAVTVEEPQKQE